MPLLASRFAALSLLGPPLLAKDDANTARADLDLSFDELGVALDELATVFALPESLPRSPARSALTCPLFAGAPGFEMRWKSRRW